MDRRKFLQMLGFGTVAAAAAATAAYDLERLLWVNGEKTFFVPPAIHPVPHAFTIGDIFTLEGQFALNPVTYQPTEYLQKFVITADVRGGETLTVEKVWPKIVTRGMLQNATSSPVRNGMIDGRIIRPELCGLRAE